MKKKYIFIQNGENIKNLLKSVFEKSEQIKRKYNCSLSKQYKNLKKFLKILLVVERTRDFMLNVK